MQIHNTPEKYGLVAKSLHWIIALLIIVAWAVGYYAADLPKTDPEKGMLFTLHKSVGMCILMLVVIRLCWRIYDVKPRSPAMLTKFLAYLARTVHYLLYAFMFIQPLSGWAMSSSAGYNPTFFGLFTFPGLVAKDPGTTEFWVNVHNTSAYILLALFIMHVGGALYHYYVLKDDTVQRIL